jgi:hypothetical protein
VKLARALVVARGGDPAIVPDWSWKDFDGIDVLRLSDGKAAFAHRQEGLNGLPEQCPAR